MRSSVGLDSLIREILQEGMEDWVPIWALPFLARSLGGARTSEEELLTSINLLRELLAREWVTAGEIIDGGFRSWSLTDAEVLDRIEREWRALSGGPNMGDIGWINLTEKGAVAAGTLSGGSPSFP